MGFMPVENGFPISATTVRFEFHYKILPRGGSRNVEGGVLLLCRAIGSNLVLELALWKAAHRGA